MMSEKRPTYEELEKRLADAEEDMVSLRREGVDFIIGEKAALLVRLKATEKKLRESEEKMRATLNALPDLLFEVDRQGRIYDYYSGAPDLLYTSPEDFIGKTVNQVLPREAAAIIMDAIGQAVETGRHTGATYSLETPTGMKWSELSISAKGDPKAPDGRLIALVRDITERKRAGERLQALNAELERSNRELEDFTYMVSHDLLEPLRKIHTFGQFLIEDCEKDLPDVGKDYIHRMQNAAVRMRGLIHHLLELSRVGTWGGRFVALQPLESIEMVLDTLRDRIQESGSEVTVGDRMPIIEADPVQLEQVFQNLIGNALKFRRSDRPPRVSITCRIENSEAIFSVADNGIGIEERHIEVIFIAFQRLHMPDEYEGAGIGLALCAKIIKRHGGRIWAESEVGEGSTFHFTIPLAQETKENLR